MCSKPEVIVRISLIWATDVFPTTTVMSATESSLMAGDCLIQELQSRDVKLMKIMSSSQLASVLK